MRGYRKGPSCPDLMAGDKRSGGGDGALTNLARGRGDCHIIAEVAIAAGPTYPFSA